MGHATATVQGVGTLEIAAVRANSRCDTSLRRIGTSIANLITETCVQGAGADTVVPERELVGQPAVEG
jgi:hypothetical protein